ncbi:MAG: fructose PTS transporter subunit IIA [Selenomonadaceae bacterium]|nr:fructose PTS transporter subunit IIA [Selenomonadaceae bacterium]
MKITNFISKKSIALNVHPADKNEAIDMLVDLLMTAGTVKDKAAVKRDILKRESQGSTGLSNGLATPHAQNNSVKKPSISIITVPEGVEYNSLDGKPARLLVLFAAPEKATDDAMTQMGRLAVLLMDESFKESLIKASTPPEVIKIIDEKEAERTKSETENLKVTGETKIVAVTACPTGISSSFMARESLKQCAEKMGLNIRVEVHGAAGVYHALTDEEIQNADFVIVAASKRVPLARFNGKKMIQTAVNTGIRKPEQLFNRIKAGQAQVFTALEDDETIGEKIYNKIKSIFS